MADKPLFWQWLDNRNKRLDAYKNGPQVGTNMTPQQLRYAMPPMRDSEVVPSINAAAGPVPAYPPVSAEEIMRQLMGGKAPNNGSMADARAQEIEFANSLQPQGGTMADARAQEIAYANSMMPQAGSMANARQQEIAFANSQPNPAARGGVGGGNVPMPPVRPTELGSQPMLYTVDFGDGSPMRQFLSKDGKAPDIPGANVMLDTSYDPNAGALAKFIRGAF
jgi:hypothetical protein